jgi:A/G-specific adenine glycosylase
MEETMLCWAVLKPIATKNLIDDASEFRSALCSWFIQNGKDYPWRRTRDPYAILVSEVMLQQTRLAVVLGKGYYERFMRTYPDVQTLASAPEEELLRVWEGLGYYRRARMLQATASAVMAHHGGVFPNHEKELLALPGIGRYTLGALRSFAFDQPSPLVDGNVMRVFARLFADDTAVDSTEGVKRSWQRAEVLLDQKHPRLYNSALMELGQTFCKVGIPDCLSCPVAAFCQSREPHSLPVKVGKVSITQIEEVSIFARQKSRVLLAMEKGTRRRGLWRFPERSHEEIANLDVIYEANYAITRYRVSMIVHAAHGIEPKNGEQWVEDNDLESFPMSAPYRKALRHLLTQD